MYFVKLSVDKYKLTIALGFIFLILAGAGCESVPTQSSDSNAHALKKADSGANSITQRVESLVVLPIDENIGTYSPTYRRFGEYFQGRFTGYHVAEDSEVSVEDLRARGVIEVPVRAIADGTVRYIDRVSGYGGVVVIKHEVGDENVNAIYGHIDLGSSNLKAGDRVTKSQFIANLGDDKSRETDGERRHLHFALYRGDDLRLQGYEKNPEKISDWINPYDFFTTHGVEWQDFWRTVKILRFPEARDIFRLTFGLPHDWDVEFIPSLKAINLYYVSGSGTARERSQILIRYFDAAKFLTLNTVTIHETTDLVVGKNNYTARRYDIEKKPGVADFQDQPSWRNGRHIVTDFRDKTGFTRYYVVAANPELDREIYEQILASMEIL